MSYVLTKRVDPGLLSDELVAAGVISFNIDNERVWLTGEMTAEELATKLATVASVEAAHVPTTFTQVTLTAEPHAQSFAAELVALGASGIGLEHPESYPGTGYVLHNSADATLRGQIKTTAEAHDPTAYPTLSVDTASQVIAADGVDTGTVTVTDSRGASASGKTVKLRIPPGGSAGADGDNFDLDGSGEATVTFQATTTYTSELEFEFYYANGEADPVTFVVRRGT